MAQIISSVWGNVPYEITQEFGIINPDTASMYPAEYTEPLGYPAGTHIGLDIGVPKNTQLYALSHGKVIQSGMSPFFRPKPVWVETVDNPSTVKDETGYLEIYGHMWTNKVRSGDRVKPGDFLGTSGEQTHPGTMNPDGTNPHLHFELRKPLGEGRYRAIDPKNWLGETQFEPDDAPPEDTIDESATETPIFDITGLLDLIGKRIVFILIGIVLLAIGVIFTLRG